MLNSGALSTHDVDYGRGKFSHMFLLKCSSTLQRAQSKFQNSPHSENTIQNELSGVKLIFCPIHHLKTAQSVNPMEQMNKRNGRGRGQRNT